MKTLFKIGFKEIPDINTTILHTSDFNITNDSIEFLNNKCEVIMKNAPCDLNLIPNSLLLELDLLELRNKKELTKQDEITINILTSLTTDKKVVVFCDILSYIDNGLKSQIISKLKSKNKIIINYTSNIEETLLLEYLMVTNKDAIIMEGLTTLVLQEEKILKRLGFGLPFIVELSSGLKYYHIIDKIYFDPESLVNDLWK